MRFLTPLVPAGDDAGDPLWARLWWRPGRPFGETHPPKPPRSRRSPSFDDRNPFSGGVVVAARTAEGRKALRIDRSYVSMEQAQNWARLRFPQGRPRLRRQGADEPRHRNP